MNAVRPETQTIVTEVEERSGLPVQVLPIRDLPVLATTTLSPHATDSYVIQVRAGVPFRDYAVAFQCGHILRTLALPEPDRAQLAATPAGMRWGRDLVRTHLASTKNSNLPGEVLDGFTRNLVGGLLGQLRSIPIGMRIDAWIAEDFPSLGDLQAEAIAAQQREALGSLSPQVKLLMPDEIVGGSIILNTAYALFCDRLLGGGSYVVPYEAAGFLELATALLQAFDELPVDPSSDRALIDRWGDDLGLRGKYEWVPFPAAASPVS